MLRCDRCDSAVAITYNRLCMDCRILKDRQEEIKMHGVKCCPQCKQPMCEDVIDGFDFYVCNSCGTKIRIFHQPIVNIKKYTSLSKQRSDFGTDARGIA